MSVVPGSPSEAALVGQGVRLDAQGRAVLELGGLAPKVPGQETTEDRGRNTVAWGGSRERPSRDESEHAHVYVPINYVSVVKVNGD